MSQAVNEAQSRLAYQDIVGTTNSGRLGLGMQCRDIWSAADTQKKRSMVQDCHQERGGGVACF